MNVKCKCGYEWNTNSKLEYVSCPSCLQKVRIKIIEKLINPKEEDIIVDEKKEAAADLAKDDPENQPKETLKEQKKRMGLEE